jgi:hypothetical protein
LQAFNAVVTRTKEIPMMGYFVVAFIVLMAPLSYYWGVDSRRFEDRGWAADPASRNYRAPGGLLR